MDYVFFIYPWKKKRDEETKDELLKKIRQGGKENKDFIGARFGKLDLAYEVLGTEADNHHVDLRFAEVDELDMNNTIIRQSWNISKSTTRECHFRRTVFERNSEFTGAEFREQPEFINATFGGMADFTGVEFREMADFTEAKFRERTNFTGAEFRARAEFSDTRFGGVANFAGAGFRERASFNHAEFREKAKFSGAKFRTVNFIKSEFREQSNFSAKFGTVTFINSEFGGVAEFTEAKFKGVAGFTGVEFRERASFNRAEFGGGIANFLNAEFRGMAFFDRAEFVWAASFLGTKFSGRTFFRGTEFGRSISFKKSTFNYVDFGGTEASVIDLEDATLNYVAFGGTEASVIDLEDATIHEGGIQQPEDSSTFYDFTGATLGDVTIRRENSYHDLFDYFRFYRTDFDGFDFTDYKDELGSNPQIHEFKYTPEDESEEREDRPDELEATYLKAKDGAKKVGDHELASEFFIKEMQYRRERYKDEIENEDLDRKRRAKLEFDRRVNWLYEMTSGYGEKPIRVILTSLSVVVLFTFLYPFWGIRQTGDGTARTLSYASASAPAEFLDVIAHSSYFSSVTFTTLGYGDLHPVGFSRILSMVQSATGALLIALLIFVFGRSVKW